MKRITNLIGVKYIAFLKKNHTKQGEVREIIKDVTDLCVMYICGFDFDSISLFSRILQNKTTPFCFFFAFFYFTEKRSIS